MMAAQENPDVGARMVSSSIALTEARAVHAHPTFVAVEPGMGRAAIGYGDGSVKAVSVTMEGTMVSTIANLDATPLAGVTDAGGRGLIVGTDKGTLIRIDGSAVSTLATVDDAWIDQVAVAEKTGYRAFSARRTLYVLDRDGNEVLRRDAHPSTVAGLTFSPDGEWIGAAHYGGISVWNVAEASAEPVLLEWHGSHTAVTWSPDGKFVVSAMQDREMHCWRWEDRKSMRMSGYPSKIRSLSWTADGRYVAVSGADTVTSWDCSGAGPSGRAPLEFGYVYNGVVMQVAAHPSAVMVAAGYSDGTVMIGDIEQETAMIARPGGGKPIAGLAWSPDGRILVAADEAGSVAVMRLKGALV